MDPAKAGSQEEESRKIIRLVRPSVVVLCGPAECGKSTFAARHFRATQIISSDQARALVSDDERDQRFQAQAFALVRFLIEQRLSINRLCVVDSTALSPESRKTLLETARKYKVPCVLFLFDVPLQTCLDRDRARQRSVGREVIERQHQLLEQAKVAVRQEGFDEIYNLGNQDPEEVHIEVLFRPVSRAVRRTAPAERRRFVPYSAQGRVGWPLRSLAEEHASGERRPVAPSPRSQSPTRESVPDASPPAPVPHSSPPQTENQKQS